MKRILLTLFLPILLLVFTPSVLANSNGRVGFSTGNSCNLCHGGGDVPTVTLDGPSVLAPNQTGTFTLTIESGTSQLADPAKTAGGFNVSAEDGVLGVLNSDAKTWNGELTHTTPKGIDTANNVVFVFSWQAPATADTYTLFGAGNSVNGNGAASGDAAATDTFDVVVSVPTAVGLERVGVESADFILVSLLIASSLTASVVFYQRRTD